MNVLAKWAKPPSAESMLNATSPRHDSLKALPGVAEDSITMRFILINTCKHRRGIAAIYSILMLVVLCGLVSMGVDLGRVQLAKTELRSAADAACRAGAAGLAKSVSQCKTDAVAVAAANTCDTTSVALDSTQD